MKESAKADKLIKTLPPGILQPYYLICRLEEGGDSLNEEGVVEVLYIVCCSYATLYVVLSQRIDADIFIGG